MINKEVYTADFSMGVGNIIPHLIAGWSGGGKIIQPGVCGEETTGMTHVLAGTEGADTLLGNLNQKVRREIDEVATRAGLKLVLNTVLNKREEMAQVFIGHHVEALKEGVRFAERIYKRRIPARADIVVASSYPADLDYWQAIKGVVSASFAVKRGGTIFLITPCPEKISPTHPELEKIGSLSLADSLRMVQTGEFRDKVACGVCLFHARLRERFKIIVYSVGMSRREVEALGLTYARSVKEGMRLAYESQRENAAIGVIRNSEVLPYLA